MVNEDPHYLESFRWESHRNEQSHMRRPDLKTLEVCLRRLQASKPEQPHSGLVWGLSRSCEPHRNLLLSKIFIVHKWAVILWGASKTHNIPKAERHAGLTAGRAKKETPMRVNVAANSLPFQV